MTSTKHRKGMSLVGAVGVLCLLLVAIDAEAGDKKKKKKKKKKQEETTEQPAESAAQPPQAVVKAERELLAYNTGAARKALGALASGEGDPFVLAAEGRVLTQEKHFDEAAKRLNEAATKAAKSAAPLVYLGEAHLAAGNKGAADSAFGNAVKRAESLLASEPNDTDALYYLGVAQQRLKRYDQAVATFEKLRRLEPANEMATFQLGVTRAFQEQWQGAVDLLTEAIGRNSGIAYAYYYRGLSAGQLGRKDLLINDLDRFLFMAPEAPEAPKVRKILEAA